MTKFNLFALLVNPDASPVTLKGVTGYLSSIQREDGSGRSFNVTLNTKTGPRTVHIRTVD